MLIGKNVLEIEKDGREVVLTAKVLEGLLS